jgi:hypothetical protein
MTATLRLSSTKWIPSRSKNERLSRPEILPDFRSRARSLSAKFNLRRGGGGKRDPHAIARSTTMVIGILLSIAAIGIFCWLLFTLAIYALPLFAGVAARSST